MAVSFDTSIPRLIAFYVCNELLKGAWLPCTAVPALRELAMGFEVNVHHAEEAEKVLEEYGIVEKGTDNARYFSKDAITKARRLLKDDFAERHLPVLRGKMEILEITDAELMSMLHQKTAAR
jgi:DNA-binding transcriptional regulator YhcF (GntR family)